MPHPQHSYYLGFSHCERYYHQFLRLAVFVLETHSEVIRQVELLRRYLYNSDDLTILTIVLLHNSHIKQCLSQI